MRSTEARIASLENGSKLAQPVYRMKIGETDEQACARLGLTDAANGLFVQRVIVRKRDRRAEH